MDRIIARQNSAARPITGKAIVLGLARITLELAIVQTIVHFIIRASGIGLFSTLFYLYAIVLLIRSAARAIAGNIYTLNEETLELQRLLGDSTVLDRQMKCSDVISIRPIVCGERLHLDYHQVTYVDPACAPGLRMRLAFGMSLVWAWLARMIAGKKAQKENGYIVVYMEGKRRCVCAFRPNEAFLNALKERFAEVFGVDDRLAREKLVTYYAKSLRRTFGGLYPHVPDGVSEEELAFAQEEFARRKEIWLGRFAKVMKTSPEKCKAQLARIKRKRAAFVRKAKALFAGAMRRMPFVTAIRKKLVRLARKISRFVQKVRREEELDRMDQDETDESPRRRRGRQE